MGQPAAVRGDRIVGTCTTGHLVPSASGTAPAPPQQFSAPVEQGLAGTVLIHGAPAAVAGATGHNDAPHAGLCDARSTPTAQVATIVSGSATVCFDGRAAAHGASPTTICYGPGQRLQASADDVLIGGAGVVEGSK